MPRRGLRGTGTRVEPFPVLRNSELASSVEVLGVTGSTQLSMSTYVGIQFDCTI